MRSKVVFAILVLIFLGFGASFAFRTFTSPALVAGPEPAQPMASASASAIPIVSATAASAVPPSASAKPLAKKLMDRPLRVAALGWDLIAPGVLANEGLSPTAESAFTRAGVDVALIPMDSMKKLEEALARGGSDESGADVAVLPMPFYVAAFERLRALDPKVFFVVGWSKGREALYSKEASLTKVPEGKITLLAEPATPSAFMSLFLIETAGVSPDRIALQGTGEKKPPTFEAVALSDEVSPDPARGSLLLTTADVPRLVPLVAVAQGGTLAKHTEALSVWAWTWLDGEERIRADAAASARTIAKVQGAPNPLVLINRLGPIGWATLGENAQWAGLAGRGAVTLETLFQRTWTVWRSAGLLSTPIPETACTAPEVIASLVRQHGADLPKTSAKKDDGDRGQEKVLLVYSAPGAKLDEAAFVKEIGVLAGLFDRSELRISVRGPRHRADAERIMSDAQGRFGIEAGRLRPSTKPATKAGMVEVIAPR